jgi:hypothetical protein
LEARFDSHSPLGTQRHPLLLRCPDSSGFVHICRASAKSCRRRSRRKRNCSLFSLHGWIRHLAAATSELKEWEQKNPDASKGMDDDELKNAGSITEQAKIFDSKFLQGTAILKKNGFPTREYLISLYAFVQAAMVVALKKAGQAPSVDNLAGVVNPTNIDLVEKNWEEVQKLNVSLGLPAATQ